MKTRQPVRVMDLRGTYKGGGGPDKTILLSAKQHNPERVHVLVTYLRDPKDRSYAIDKKAADLGINYVDVYDRYLIDWRCVKNLSRLIKQHRLGLLHAHDDKTLLYGWILKKLHPKLKIIYTCHLLLNYTPLDFSSYVKYLNYAIRRRISILLTKRYLKPIMAVSESTKRQLITEGLNPSDIIVLHNGIDIDQWQRKNGQPILREELKLNREAFLVGTVARIDQQKDFSTFFKVVKLVRGQAPNTKFVIVGDGKSDELSNVKKLAHSFGLGDDIYFTGHRNDLFDVYSSLEIFLMTSVMEGLPNTVLEAMAMEVPVVSTIVAGVPELVADNETGYLCRIGDSEALAKKVITLLKDSDLCDQFAKAGRKRIVRHFSFKDRVKKLEAYYEYFSKAIQCRKDSYFKR